MLRIAKPVRGRILKPRTNSKARALIHGTKFSRALTDRCAGILGASGMGEAGTHPYLLSSLFSLDSARDHVSGKLVITCPDSSDLQLFLF